MDDDVRLIQLVRANEILYNKRHCYYKDTFRKHDVWQSIGKEMSMDPERCSHRWTALRDRYTRERRRLDGALERGVHNDNLREWHLMPDMDFLRNIVLPARKTVSWIEAARRSYNEGKAVIVQPPAAKVDSVPPPFRVMSAVSLREPGQKIKIVPAKSLREISQPISFAPTTTTATTTTTSIRDSGRPFKVVLTVAKGGETGAQPYKVLSAVAVRDSPQPVKLISAIPKRPAPSVELKDLIEVPPLKELLEVHPSPSTTPPSPSASPWIVLPSSDSASPPPAKRERIPSPLPPPEAPPASPSPPPPPRTLLSPSMLPPSPLPSQATSSSSQSKPAQSRDSRRTNKSKADNPYVAALEIASKRFDDVCAAALKKAPIDPFAMVVSDFMSDLDRDYRADTVARMSALMAQIKKEQIDKRSFIVKEEYIVG